MRPVVPEETKRTPRDAALILSVRERSSRHKRQRCELQGQTHGIEVPRGRRAQHAHTTEPR